MMNILHDSDYNRSKAFNFRVGRSEPLNSSLETDPSEDLYLGHLVMSDKDLYYHRDWGYQGVLREDTEGLCDNMISGEDFVFNRWYYFQHNPTEFVTSSSDVHLFACNPNHYFIMKTKGRIAPDSEYNEFGIDFTLPLNDELRLVIEESQDKNTWVSVYNYQLPYIAGAYRLTKEIMLIPMTHTYYRMRVYLPAYPSQEIEIIDGFPYFNIGVEVYRKPRLSWKKRFGVMPNLSNASTELVYTFPIDDGTLVLPYMGIYEVNAFVTTLEADINDIPVNCASPQGLYLSGDGNSFFQIDQSGTGDGGPNAPDFFWAPNSLQGSSFVEVLGNKTIKLMVFLPNGFKKLVLGGYIDIRFAGDMYSPCLEV